MTEYTASNGITVRAADDKVTLAFDGNWEDVWIDHVDQKALGEFFQHERDKELGRWRYPKDERYVVYGGYSPGEDTRFARVLQEQTGIASVVYEGSGRPSEVQDIAVAYFEAHPERKPWEDAKPGEVWVLTEHGQPERAYLVDDTQFYDSSRDYALNFGDSLITDARRIWPEEEA